MNNKSTYSIRFRDCGLIHAQTQRITRCVCADKLHLKKEV